MRLAAVRKYQAAIYSPFHSSLPFEHLGQSKFAHSSLPFVCKSGNFLFYFRTETVSQVPGVLKIYSAFILGNDVTSSDKNSVIAWLKHSFISKFFAQHIQWILRTHNYNRIETKAEFYQFKQLPDRYLQCKNST